MTKRISAVRIMSRRPGVQDWHLRTTVKVDQMGTASTPYDTQVVLARRKAIEQHQAWVNAEPQTEFRVEEVGY